MDKKTIMQTMADGYHRMSGDCKYDIEERLSRIADSFDEKTLYIIRSKQFWDDISDERIAREQEKYLEHQRILSDIVDLMEKLELYMKEETS